MDLWVRSQDREIILSKPILIVDNNRILTPKNDYRDTHLVLGQYKTKERALEVLDEIQEAKLGNFHYKCPSNVKVSDDGYTIVYVMPKD